MNQQRSYTSSSQQNAPKLNPRQRNILEYARKNGEVQVDPLAESFRVTPQTIRRDLNQLCHLRLLQRVHGGIVGETTADFFARFKVDYAVIGVSAIEEDGTLLDYDPREVRVAQAIIKNARSVILVADSMKFERNAPVRLGKMDQIDYFVTDEKPSPEFFSTCRSAGVQVEVSSPEPISTPMAISRAL